MRIICLENHRGKNFFRWLKLRFKGQRVHVGVDLEDALDELEKSKHGGIIYLFSGTYNMPQTPYFPKISIYGEPKAGFNIRHSV